MFAAESIGEKVRFGELTSAHEEARAIDGPWTFNIHNSSPLGGGRRIVASF